MKITVEASVTRRVVAEMARVHIDATWEAAARHRAVSEAGRVAKLVSSELGKLTGEGVESYSVDPARVSTTRPVGEDGRLGPPRTTALVRIQALFSDADVLSTWAAAVAGRDGVTISQVEWMLSDATAAAVEEEVLTEAMTRARARALALAKAEGADDVETIRVTDRGSFAPRVAQAMFAREMLDDAGGSHSPVQVVPEFIEVNAAIMVRYETVAPALRPRRSFSV